jgi:hypothetical protein
MNGATIIPSAVADSTQGRIIARPQIRRPLLMCPWPRLLVATLLAIISVAFSRAAPAAREIPPAFGPHVNLQPADFAEAKSFRSTNRIVGTYYFYWYDAPSKAHIVDGDGSDA